MADGRDVLRRTALTMVATGPAPTLYELVAHLKLTTGAPQADADRTVRDLLARGALVMTAEGRIILGTASASVDKGTSLERKLAIVASVLGIIVAVLGIWEFGARNGVLGGGPFNFLFPGSGAQQTLPGRTFRVPDLSSGIPGLPTAAQLAPPVARRSGNCQDGFTIKWDPVEGAEWYSIEIDGHGGVTEQDTDHFVPGREAFLKQRYQVFAEGLLRPRSQGSKIMMIGPC